MVTRSNKVIPFKRNKETPAKTKRLKEKFTTERHHRRPESLGGSSEPGNISYVFPKKHSAWHALYANLNAEQTCVEFNKDLNLFRDINFTLKLEFINGSKVKKIGRYGTKWPILRKAAFDTLFNGLRNKEILKYVNSVWLDPSYHFYVMRN